VHEALCELELPYILQNVGEGSRRMKLLLEASGSKEVRFLMELKAYKFIPTKIAS
jgi:anaphase-promoting complex subunit 7